MHVIWGIPCAQSFLSIFAQKYLSKCEDTYFILQNKYLCIYEDSFGVKLLRDDCAARVKPPLRKVIYLHFILLSGWFA